MLHRKIFCQKQLLQAVQTLAGCGDFETRIAGASAILIHIENADVPSSLIPKLVGLKALLFDMSQSSRGVFAAAS